MRFISSWVQGIIIAVVIATIIEMILPNGNSKKYIKMVLGVFIIFNIITPIVNRFTGESIKIEGIFDNQNYINEKYQYKVNTNNLEENNSSNIKEIYILNLKKDMKSKIESKGYIVHTIIIDIEDDKDYTIKNIDLVIQKREDKDYEEIKEDSSNVSKVENVSIKVNINDNSVKEEKEKRYISINKKEENEIKDFLNQNYQIDQKKISINK